MQPCEFSNSNTISKSLVPFVTVVLKTIMLCSASPIDEIYYKSKTEHYLSETYTRLNWCLPVMQYTCRHFRCIHRGCIMWATHNLNPFSSPSFLTSNPPPSPRTTHSLFVPPPTTLPGAKCLWIYTYHHNSNKNCVSYFFEMKNESKRSELAHYKLNSVVVGFGQFFCCCCLVLLLHAIIPYLAGQTQILMLAIHQTFNVSKHQQFIKNQPFDMSPKTKSGWRRFWCCERNDHSTFYELRGGRAWGMSNAGHLFHINKRQTHTQAVWSIH